MSQLDHMDALAAEYVLGSLDFEERARARNLLEADPTFAAKVQLWERRFGELHLMVEPVEPDSSIWVRIKAKLPEVEQGIRPPQPPLSPATPAPAAEPPSLDAIEAAISQAATTLSAEASSAATQEAAPQSPSEVTTVSEAMHVPTSEAAPQSPSEVTTVSETMPVPTSAAVVQPPSEATTASEAMPVPAAETASAPTAEAAPAPSPDVTRTSAVEAVPSPPVAPATAAAAPELVRDQTLESTTAVVRRRLKRWQAYAIFMTLVVAAVAALLAAWRFAPDRVPPVLQPLEVMRQIGVTLPAGPAPRRPAPPESRFDE
jgi:hypothetical protein